MKGKVMNSREMKQHVERQKLGQARHVFGNSWYSEMTGRLYTLKKISGDKVKC